jgi:putative addiction module component (TIGR02574 family)
MMVRGNPVWSMTMTAADIISDAMKLSLAERAAVAQELLRSLDGDSADPDADQVWQRELTDRSDAFHDGQAGASNADAVVHRVRASLDQERRK